MGKYSKVKLRSRRWIVTLGVVLLVMLTVGVGITAFVVLNNNISYARVQEAAASVSDDYAINSYPILVNNVIVGATYNGSWVSNIRYYAMSKNKEGTDLDVYSQNNKAGTFKISSFTKDSKTASAFAILTRPNYSDEYYAIKSGQMNMGRMKKKELTASENQQFVTDAKKALGMYGMLNDTIAIKSCYEVNIEAIKSEYVLIVNSSGNAKQGAYSAIIFVDNTLTPHLIKYNYVRDTKNASEFGILSLKFVADLNADGRAELILQETKEFETKYSVIDMANDRFEEVLSAVIKN